MADPTLKDVLKAIAQVQGELAATRVDLAKVDAKVDDLQDDVTAHRAETKAHRAETKKGFADLDAELTGHTKVHREIERDIEYLKGRPPRTAARAPRRPRAR